MPRVIKRRPAPKPAAPAGPPRLVIVELLDLTPAADGRTVIARTLTVLETAAGQVIEDWKKAKGYRVRVVEQRTPESDKYVYAQHKRFIGAGQCQPSSSSEVTREPSGKQTPLGTSRSSSSVPVEEIPGTGSMSTPSKTAPSARSPQPSSKPSSKAKESSRPLPSKVSTRSRTTSTSATPSPRTTFRQSVESFGNSNSEQKRQKPIIKPTAASKRPTKAVKAIGPKKPVPAKATTVKSVAKMQRTKSSGQMVESEAVLRASSIPTLGAVHQVSPTVAAVRLF